MESFAVSRWFVRAALAVAGTVAIGSIGIGGEGGVQAGATSSAEASVIVPLDQVRILDTRTGVGASVGKLLDGQTITLQVTGVGGVPAGATGVVLNLTVNEPDGAGYVSAYPAGGTRPNASVINYKTGADVANMVTATLSSGGALDLYNAQGEIHLIADVAGYLTPGSGTLGSPGPAGPQGPQGPAGPGANVLVNVPVPNPTSSQVIGAYAGFTLRASCGPDSTALMFDTGLLRITGSKELFDGLPPRLILDSWTAGTRTEPAGASGQMLFSGVLDATGATSWVELGIRYGSPCFVWGTIIPSS